MNSSVSKPVIIAEVQRTQRERLAAVVLLTKRMLDLARENEWEQVSESERCRQCLLQDCFEAEVQPHNSQLFSEAIAAMLHMNEELMAILAEARREASTSLCNERRGHQAVSYYLDVSSD